MKRTLLVLLLVPLTFSACHTKKQEVKTTPPQEVNLASADRKEAEPGISAKQTRGPAAPSLMARRSFAGGLEMDACLAMPLPESREQYNAIEENGFRSAIQNPLSTFSIDVDVASYANIRRFINSNTLPPQDAVRIEELINYFPYSYKQPVGSDPVSITAEMASCPWQPQHRLARVGLKGREIQSEKLPPSNLVFLIDVSGSMADANKLPLLKNAFRLLVKELRRDDKVSLVVYAGSAGLVLPATPGHQKEKILEALDRLNAGGSTAGGEGIQLAYEIAKKNYLKNGNNRVILATDGDFNVGVSEDGELERLIEEKRKDGVFLTVLGFGMGNYKDSKMEILADKGNGNYAYIDSLLEAKKVLVSEMGATLHTIAKDVKIQVEFNPAKVQAYRLIGYENRLLAAEDFNNDKKDAGEMGAGSTVTALYEIIPVGVKSSAISVDPLKYQKPAKTEHAEGSSEWMTVKFRYKEPTGTTSQLVSHSVTDQGIQLASANEDFRFSAAVAGFGMLLRNSEFKNGFTYDKTAELAQGAIGSDPEGYRAEFIRLVKASRTLQSAQSAVR